MIKKNNKNYTFSAMAVAHGKVSTDETVIKKYIGIAAVKILAINPDRKTMNKIFGSDKDDEIEYIGTNKKAKNSKGEDIEVPQIRISFVCQTDPTLITNQGIDSKFIFSIYLSKGFMYSVKPDHTKVKVIDKYGRTAWVTEEEVKTHAIPQYSNGPANLDKDYHPMHLGEDQLVDFIKCYLGIPEVDKWNQEEQKFEMVKDPQNCECSLEHIQDYFKGDLKELKDIIGYQPDNKVKIVCGVRTTEKGQFQSVYTRKFIRLGANKYNFIDKMLTDEAEYLKDTEYDTCKLKEYVDQPSDYSKEVPVTGNTPDPFKQAAQLPEGDNDLPF